MTDADMHEHILITIRHCISRVVGAQQLSFLNNRKAVPRISLEIKMFNGKGGNATSDRWQVTL